MSYEIEYRYVVLRFDAQPVHAHFNALAKELGMPEHFRDYCPIPAAAVFVEHGSNNTYENNTNRRARHWSLYFAGSIGCDVMRKVIDFSWYVETGLTKPFGRDIRAESYIAAMRKRIDEGMPLEQFLSGLGDSSARIRVSAFEEDLAMKDPYWVKAEKDGRIAPTRYGKSIRVDRLNPFDVACALMVATAVSKPGCIESAWFDGIHDDAIVRRLDRVAGGYQPELFAA